MPVAETFRFSKNGGLLNRRAASEYMMQRYYRAAHTVTQLNIILLQNLHARLFPKPSLPVRINDRFNEVNNHVDITNDKVFLDHPSALLEVFYLLSQRSDLKNMTARTLRAMWHARIHIDRTLCYLDQPVLFPAHTEITTFRGTSPATYERTGHTGRYLPNFGKIVGQMSMTCSINILSISIF